MELSLPKYKLQIQEKDGKKMVFDPFRKKYVVLTPEEYVRQYFARFLTEEKGFPSGLTAIEHRLKFYDLNRRADIVNYNAAGHVVMITECKAPSVNISQKTFDQIARYNMKLKARFLVVTNGLNHFCCEYLSGGNYRFLRDIPHYTQTEHNP